MRNKRHPSGRSGHARSLRSSVVSNGSFRHTNRKIRNRDSSWRLFSPNTRKFKLSPNSVVKLFDYNSEGHLNNVERFVREVVAFVEIDRNQFFICCSASEYLFLCLRFVQLSTALYWPLCTTYYITILLLSLF